LVIAALKVANQLSVITLRTLAKTGRAN